MTSEFSISRLESYHRRAVAISQESHDAQTQVAAILINKDSGAVIAEGFNGFVRGAPDDKLPATRPEKYKYMIHAETNLLCNAARHGISTNNCVVYCTLSPCTHCVRLLYQCGITEIFFKDKYSDFDDSATMGDLVIDCQSVEHFYKLTISPFK